MTHDQEEATEVADRVVVMSGAILNGLTRRIRYGANRRPVCARIYGRSEPPAGTIRGGQFHVGAHRGRWATHLRIRGRWISSCALGKWISAAVPASIRRCRYRYWKPAERSLHPIWCRWWYNEPLTVVMHGDDAARGERLFVGLQHARLYNGDERIETAMRNCSRTAPDRLSEC